MIAYGSKLNSVDNTNEGVEPGDLIHVCMSYAGVTNVFYKVLSLNGSQSITVCELGRKFKKHPDYLKTFVRPDYDIMGAPFRMRVTRYTYLNTSTGEERVTRMVKIHKNLAGLIIKDDPECWWTDDDAD